jgi:hypothetical protein
VRTRRFVCTFLRYRTTLYATFRRLSAHGAHMKMASFMKLPSGSWRVQVRRKGRYVSETFLRSEDARRWALEAECQVDRGDTPIPSRVKRLKTFGDLINLHVEDIKEVGKAPGRSKHATLVMLKRELGALAMDELDRDRLIKFGRKRASQGAGPVTVSMDIGAIRLVVSHAAAVHGLKVWSDLNARTKMLIIRDRKDPRAKKGNDQPIPLLAVSGYDASHTRCSRSAPSPALAFKTQTPLPDGRRDSRVGGARTSPSATVLAPQQRRSVPMPTVRNPSGADHQILPEEI